MPCRTLSAHKKTCSDIFYFLFCVFSLNCTHWEGKISDAAYYEHETINDESCCSEIQNIENEIKLIIQESFAIELIHNAFKITVFLLKKISFEPRAQCGKSKSSRKQ